MKFRSLLLSCVLALSLSGCYAFSTFQSAKTVEKGHWQGAAAVSSNSFYDEDGSSESINESYEVQVRTGISEKADIGVRYTRLTGFDFIDDYNHLSIEPKYMVVPNKFSLVMPMAMFFGSDINEDESFHVAPGFIATYPVNNNFDVSFSPRYMIFTDSDSDDLVALNFGVGLSSDLTKWAIRPEIGLLYNPGESGHYMQFGIGFSLNR